MVNAIATMPRIPIRNGVAGGGAATATAKNAIAHSGIVSRRWITSAISYLPPFVEFSRGTRLETLHAPFPRL
jgi:hypothetical protein